MKRFLLITALVLAAVPAKAADWLVPYTSYTVNFTTTAASAEFRISNYVEAVRVVASTAAWIAVAYTPEATSGYGLYLPADEPLTLAAKPGTKVGVVSTGSGTLYITEMTR